MGNAGLCGAPRLGFSPCLNNSHPIHINFQKYALSTILIAFAILLSCLYLVHCKTVMLRREATSSAPTMNDLNTHMLVTYYEIVQATNNFSEANLLGLGSFGKVFKGQLSSGLVVAIKVFNMQLEHTLRSFDAECRALRMARHTNLIRILGTCSNLDFRAIVLPYTANGNLQEYLHSHGMPCLGFLKRLDVMLEVSMALEYLHHQHYALVLHCDLKPSNVLFDTNMTAHLADFGIAKLLIGDSNSVSTRSMPGTIGYMAPKYGFMGRASRESDVFSYGIMLLEVFSGKKPTDPLFVGGLNIRGWVHQAFPSRLKDIIDNRLIEMQSVPQTTSNLDRNLLHASPDVLNNFLLPIFEIGLVCSSDSPNQRMTMSNVVAKFTKIKADYLKFTTTQTAESFQ